MCITSQVVPTRTNEGSHRSRPGCCRIGTCQRHVTLTLHLSSDELERWYRSAHEPHERNWGQILWLLARGQTARQVAASTGYSPYWIGQLAKRYNTEGPAGMRNRARLTSHRQAPLLSAEQQEDLRQALAGPPPGAAPTVGRRSGGRWRCARFSAGWIPGPGSGALGGHGHSRPRRPRSTPCLTPLDVGGLCISYSA
jgi:hypothetical protein